MASVINTNVSSLYAQRNLTKSQGDLTTSLQRLSSGLRINSAKDDAAGMSISERMTAQVRGIDQAVRNSNDGISLAQTAEGGLNDITSSLQRLRELAVQSSNAAVTDTDRVAIQTETEQLTSEIDRIAAQTNFNGIKLLDGSFKNQNFQIGANEHQTLAVGIGSVRTSKLGVTDTSSISSRQGYIQSATTAAGAYSTLAIADGDLVVNGVSIAVPSTVDDAASSIFKNLSSISKAAAINKSSAQTGVTATVNTNVAKGVSMTAAASASVTFIVNGATITTSTASNNAATRQSIVSAFNAKTGQTGVTAVDTGNDYEGVVLKATDGRNIQVTTTAAAGGVLSSTTGVKTGVFIGSYTLSSTKDINVNEGSGNIAHAGFTKGTYGPQTAYASNQQTSDSGADFTDRTSKFSTGDFRINGTLVGNSLDSDDTASNVAKSASAIAKAAAINRLTSVTGVTAHANATSVRGTAMAGGATTTGNLVINGVTTDTILTTSASTAISRQNVVKAINAVSNRTGVIATDMGTETYGVRLSAADGRNIMLSVTGNLTSAGTGLELAKKSYYGGLTLTSGKSFSISAGINDVAGVDHLGMGVGTYGGTRTGGALSDVNLSTQAGASEALSSVDNAINTINTQRATLGALQNRFGSTISNLQSSSYNLTSARSQIQDADFAKETAQLTRNQILQQAGVAMLGQANQFPQQVLSLLR
ncbi:flagellin [Gammaproteobacteria bacterium]